MKLPVGLLLLARTAGIATVMKSGCVLDDCAPPDLGLVALTAAIGRMALDAFEPIAATQAA